MVNNLTTKLDHTFSALGDPTRRAILRRLARGPATVRELSKPFHVSKPAISKHLRVLENAGLMRRQIVGREHVCRLDPKPLATASSWIEKQREIWSGLLDSLEVYLKQEQAQEENKK